MEDGREHDRPLSLRFQTKRYAPAFKDALGLSPTGTAIAIDICSSPDSPTSYSRTRGHYLKPNRYRNPLYTLDKVIGSVDRLDALGLIDHDKRAPGERGWQSTLSPRSDLIGITRRILGDGPLVILPPKELVLLKDRHGDLVDYRDTRVQERQRKNLRTYNEALSATRLPPQIAAPVVRIYNEDFGRNGRFYAMGDSWQNLKRAARLDLQIAGERVVELDFKTLHPAMLYADAGAAIPDDCYDIPPWERDLAKVGLLTIINAPTEARARGSLAHKHFSQGMPDDPGEPGEPLLRRRQGHSAPAPGDPRDARRHDTRPPTGGRTGPHARLPFAPRHQRRGRRQRGLW